MINKTSEQLRTLMRLSAFFYFDRIRALLCVSGLLLVAVSAHAEPKIHALTKVIEGHSTGGVTVDALGNIYVADFGEIVWKITPEGKRDVFASGLYGASGNAIDHEGNLLQSNFYGDSITKIDRKGQAQPFASSGLSGPVRIAINKQTGNVLVANCRGNSIAKIAKDGTVSLFAKSDLFNCPNGIAFDGEGNLYVVNKMLKIDSQGAVAIFTTISAKGLGHLCFNQKDRFYVTASQSHEIYEVMLDGKSKCILGSGERGIVDGADTKARLSFPNGIVRHPWAQRLYINEFVNETPSTLPRRAIVREIILGADQP
jgi:DNA-binding beta-propeller fold protein YncE